MSAKRMTALPPSSAVACPCCHRLEARLPHPRYTRCARCGHCWRAPVEAAQAGYYESLVARNDPHTPWFERKTAERVTALSRWLPGVERVLEVGCAEGTLGAEIKARFPVVYDGLELSRDGAVAQHRLDQVFQVYARDVRSPAYDLIVSFHVLEHIVDPRDELQAWSALLARGGRVLLEVPNQAGHPLLESDRNLEHLHQFTPASLAVLLGGCGFTCQELSLGHYESPVYPDSIRVVACRQLTADEQRVKLLQCFQRTLGGPFIAYGIGGDYLNYVAPLADVLEIHALVDSSASKWGQRIGDHIIAGYDPVAHGALPILVCSVRFGAEIKQQLLATGIDSERIIGLEAVYEHA